MPVLSAEPCELHLLRFCADCASRPRPVSRPGWPIEREAPLLARWEGRCAECQQSILTGDPIRPRSGGDSTGWVHAGC